MSAIYSRPPGAVLVFRTMTSHDSPRERRELLIEAQRLAQEIDRVEDELELFRERDRPAFERWFTGHFAAERDQIRGLEAELARRTERHNAVLALAQMKSLSPEDARARLDAEDRAYAAAAPAEREALDQERRMRREYIALDLEREFRRRTENITVEPPPEEIDVEECKATYRRLVRRLHPDVPHDPADVSEARWRRRSWRLLQDARDRGDARVIGDLYLVTRLRQMDLGDFDAADAHRVHAWLRRDLDDRTVERDRARDSVAWRFTKVEPDWVARRVREELRADQRALRAEIRLLAEDAPDRATTPPRRARPPRASATSIQQLSFFD